MSKTKPVETQEEWATAVQNLFQNIADWAKNRRNWTASSREMGTVLPNSGEYFSNHGLVINIDRSGKSGSDEINFEAIGHRADGKGVVEMTAWPTLVRVRLLHTPGEAEWEIVTSDGIPLRRDWNEKEFVQLVKDLLDVA